MGSLCRGPAGHGGKIDYLRRQMVEQGLNLLGIQEARTERGMSFVDGIIRIAGGGQGHLYGLELWINTHQPAAYVCNKPQYFTRADFVVTHADPRLLIIHAVNSFIDCWIVVAHAPHSGRPLEERERWWNTCSELLRQHTAGSITFLLIDANSNGSSR